MGVNSNASDAAALLAASSDLSVKPSYERLQAAPEAHNAALAAKRENITAWTRGKEDPLADAAAASAKAAEAVPRKLELGIPASYDKGSVYRMATSNSTSTMTSRSTPEKSVAKHGLASKTSTITSQSLNIGKISQLADQNSLKMINSRFNPEQDYRAGIPIKPAEFLTAEEEKLAAQSAGRSLTLKHGAGYSDSVSQQKRTKTFQAADVVDATLLAAASAKAAERLNSISLADPINLREQAQIYSKALATAQKNSEERLKNHNLGLIDLGGGLKLPIGEIDKLALMIVQPVLNDINEKATAQRESDATKKLKFAELLQLHEKFKVDDFNRKQKEKADRKQAEKERIEANEGRKKNEDELYTTYQGERNTEVDDKTQELKELEEKYAGEREVLLTEKQLNEDTIQEEESGLIGGRKKELEELQAEKDEELKPTLDELEIETGKLKELTDSKNQLEGEVESGEKLKAEYEAKIAELKEKLEQTKTSFETTTAELEETTSKRETTDKEVDDLRTNKASEDETALLAHGELDEQVSTLEKEKEQHLATKASHKKDILLEIDEQVKDEHKINKELPEHLQHGVDESRFRDVGSLFSAEEKPAVVEETKVEEPKAKEAIPKESKPKVAPVAVKSDTTNTSTKKGFRHRMNSIKQAFKTPQPPKPAAKTAQKTAPATVASTLHKDEKGPKKLESKASATKEKSPELAYYEEDISIRDDRSKKEGFFKEEI